MEWLKSIWAWAQANSNGLSILLSLLGFLVVLLQLRKTRNAAESSRVATELALRVIADTDTITDLATIRERFKKVQTALRNHSYETALHEAQYLRESLHQLRNRKGFDTDESHLQIQGMVTFLSKFQDRLEWHLEDTNQQISVRSVNAKLSDYATKVSEWMEQMRFIRGGDR